MRVGRRGRRHQLDWRLRLARTIKVLCGHRVGRTAASPMTGGALWKRLLRQAQRRHIGGHYPLGVSSSRPRSSLLAGDPSRGEAAHHRDGAEQEAGRTSHRQKRALAGDSRAPVADPASAAGPEPTPKRRPPPRVEALGNGSTRVVRFGLPLAVRLQVHSRRSAFSGSWMDAREIHGPSSLADGQLLTRRNETWA